MKKPNDERSDVEQCILDKFVVYGIHTQTLFGSYGQSSLPTINKPGRQDLASRPTTKNCGALCHFGSRSIRARLKRP